MSPSKIDSGFREKGSKKLTELHKVIRSTDGQCNIISLNANVSHRRTMELELSSTFGTGRTEDCEHYEYARTMPYTAALKYQFNPINHSFILVLWFHSQVVVIVGPYALAPHWLAWKSYPLCHKHQSESKLQRTSLRSLVATHMVPKLKQTLLVTSESSERRVSAAFKPIYCHQSCC